MLLKRRKKEETKDQRPKNQNFQKVGDGMEEEGETAGGHEHMGELPSDKKKELENLILGEGHLEGKKMLNTGKGV